MSEGPAAAADINPTEPQSAGTRLRLAREAAGLTLDDVAQQLKLARRQVVALENDDVDALPGPTFVRGFIRNYARLLKIDPAPLIEANRQPGAQPAAAAMESIAPTVTELPREIPPQGKGVARWLIPTGLVLLLIAGVGYYQFSDMAMVSSGKKAARAADNLARGQPGDAGTGSAGSVDRATATGTAGATSVSGGEATTASAGTQGPTAASVPSASASIPAGTNQPSQQMAAGPASGQPMATSTNPAPPPGEAPEGRLEFEFGSAAWVEVRDKHGDVLISRTMPAKSKHLVRGEMPLTLRVGNASNVRVVLDGKPVDLTPHIRNEIAKLVLPSAQP